MNPEEQALSRPERPKTEHLKDHQWKKGTSGNPGGRPKGRSVTAALRELARSEHNGKTLAELVAERLMKEALSGKFPFLKEVIERLDGKVADKHQLEGAPEGRVYVCPAPRVIGEGAIVKRVERAGAAEED